MLKFYRRNQTFLTIACFLPTCCAKCCYKVFGREMMIKQKNKFLIRKNLILYPALLFPKYQEILVGIFADSVVSILLFD